MKISILVLFPSENLHSLDKKFPIFFLPRWEMVEQLYVVVYKAIIIYLGKVPLTDAQPGNDNNE